MILLNYAHPLTADQRAQVVALLGVAPEVREVPTHVDLDVLDYLSTARPGRDEPDV